MRRGDEDPRADEVAKEIDAELEAHFEGTVALLVARGWSEDEARAEARRRFGDVERYRTDLRRIGHRRRRRDRARHALSVAASTVVAAARSLRRSPGFSWAVIVTLALGLGANAAVFRVADRLLLSPPEHLDDPGAVRLLSQSIGREDGGTSVLTAFGWSDVEALRAAGLPARIAAAAPGGAETMGEGEEAVRVRVLRVDEDWLPLVGVKPFVGRGFQPEDHRADASPVALVSHGLWTSRWGGDPGVVGRVLRVGDGRYEVVGVLPEGFVGAQAPSTDIWLPVEASAADAWGADWRSRNDMLGFRVLVRLDDASAAARVEDLSLSALRASRADGYVLRGDLSSVDTWGLVPGDGPEPGPMIRVSRWLTAVALLVLLVACANVANLFLAQGERLRQESTLRRALGAGRGRLVSELLARSLLLALVGGAAALVMATMFGRALDGLFLDGLELGARPRNARLVAFIGLVAVATAMVAGLVPALVGPRTDIRGALGGQARSVAGGGRARRVLVAVQAGLSAVLLVGALLFVGSLRAALDLDLGFDADRVVVVRPEIDHESGAELDELYRDGRDLLEALPEVESVTETVAIPFLLLYGQTGRRPDQEVDDPGFAGGRGLRVNAVGADYFTTMGTEVLEGRGIEEADLVPGAEPVVVVGRSAAAELWPGGNPLGQCLIVGRGDGPCARVVGIAEEQAGTQFSLREFTPGRPDPSAWAPLSLVGHAPAALLVRLRDPSGDGVEQLRRMLQGTPGVRYAEVTSLSMHVDRQVRSWRLGATVFSLFGVVALGIAILGLYGVLTYEVARRRREIGIRMALGADSARLVASVLLPALAMVVVGLTLALPASAWIATRLGDLLYQVSPRSPSVFAGVAGTLLAGALASAVVPAVRATQVDPRESLNER